MTHIPRSRDRIWPGLLAGFLLVAAALIWTTVSLIRDPPKTPDVGQCPAHDPGNPWCIR